MSTLGVVPGAHVRLDGLQSAAHLNGTYGIAEAYDAIAGRWHVRLASGEIKALRAENLYPHAMPPPQQFAAAMPRPPGDFFVARPRMPFVPLGMPPPLQGMPPWGQAFATMPAWPQPPLPHLWPPHIGSIPPYGMTLPPPPVGMSFGVPVWGAPRGVGIAPQTPAGLEQVATTRRSRSPSMKRGDAKGASHRPVADSIRSLLSSSDPIEKPHEHSKRKRSRMTSSSPSSSSRRKSRRRKTKDHRDRRRRKSAVARDRPSSSRGKSTEANLKELPRNVVAPLAEQLALTQTAIEEDQAPLKPLGKTCLSRRPTLDAVGYGSLLEPPTQAELGTPRRGVWDDSPRTASPAAIELESNLVARFHAIFGKSCVDENEAGCPMDENRGAKDSPTKRDSIHPRPAPSLPPCPKRRPTSGRVLLRSAGAPTEAAQPTLGSAVAPQELGGTSQPELDPPLSDRVQPRPRTPLPPCPKRKPTSRRATLGSAGVPAEVVQASSASAVTSQEPGGISPPLPDPPLSVEPRSPPSRAGGEAESSVASSRTKKIDEENAGEYQKDSYAFVDILKPTPKVRPQPALGRRSTIASAPLASRRNENNVVRCDDRSGSETVGSPDDELAHSCFGRSPTSTVPTDVKKPAEFSDDELSAISEDSNVNERHAEFVSPSLVDPSPGQPLEVPPSARPLVQLSQGLAGRAWKHNFREDSKAGLTAQCSQDACTDSAVADASLVSGAEDDRDELMVRHASAMVIDAEEATRDGTLDEDWQEKEVAAWWEAQSAIEKPTPNGIVIKIGGAARVDKERERQRKRERESKEKEDRWKVEKPEKLSADRWEKHRLDMPHFKLVEEMVLENAPEGEKTSSWTYPFMDESRRCFAGLLTSPFTDGECKKYFQIVRGGTKWMRPTSWHGPMPRKTCWMVNKGCSCWYCYGTVEVKPQEFPKWMNELMGAVMPKCGIVKPEDYPDSCNLNLYDDGDSSVGWHSDDEQLFQGKFQDILIISLSLGVRRNFELRLNWPEEDEQSLWGISLGSGDLMTMEGMVQKHMQHRVPWNDDVCEPRINLTWRWVKKHRAKCPAQRRRKHPQ